MVDKKWHKIIAVLEMMTGLGIVFFWIGFFTLGLAPENPPSCYWAYERSFPLPDAVLAAGLLASASLLMVNRRRGSLLVLPCAGALVFLGLLDVSFNLQNGLYGGSAFDLLLNVFINVWCIGFGVFLLMSFDWKMAED